MTPAPNARLLRFVRAMTGLVSDNAMGEPFVLQETGRYLAELVANDDWLPDAFAQPHPQFYQQYLLYGDPLERFSVVSFVWGPGQSTPIHNHRVWGVIGMLRGAEWGQTYQVGEAGEAPTPIGSPERLNPGMTACVSPSIGDVHKVWNAYDDRASISIHVYGGNIGQIRRQVFAEENSMPKAFVSGYSASVAANLWQSGSA